MEEIHNLSMNWKVPSEPYVGRLLQKNSSKCDTNCTSCNETTTGAFKWTECKLIPRVIQASWLRLSLHIVCHQEDQCTTTCNIASSYLGKLAQALCKALQQVNFKWEMRTAARYVPNN